MIPSQRDTVILSLLKQNGVVTVAEICTYCDCSAETARRDLRRLEEEGRLIRTHGGGVAAHGAAPLPTRTNGAGLTEARAALVDRADALVVTATETKAMRLLVDRSRRAGIPIVAEATGYPGARTVVAVDNYRAGYELGQWVAVHAAERLGANITVLDVGYPQPNTEARSRGFADGLRERRIQAIIPSSLPLAQEQGFDEGSRDPSQLRRTILHVDGQVHFEAARQIAADALSVHPEINVIFGINDQSALGALEAYREAGLDENNLILAIFGLEGARTRELLARGTPFTVAVAMFPELVGRACIDAAICAYHNCTLSERIITPFAIVSHDNLSRYYRRDPHTGDWQLNWALVEQLPTAGPGFADLGQCHERPRPRRIGYVQTFSGHDWYQNVQRAMQDRCRSLGISLEVVDASQDLDHEIEVMKQAIGQMAARYVHEGDTIILDAGQTTAHLARALRGRQNLTVITSSLPVLNILRDEPGITLVATGGILRRETNAMVGPGAESALYGLRADRAFISVTGLSFSFGLSNTNIAEATVKRAMIAAAREVILLADYSKIGSDSLVKIASLESIQRLITDGGISAHDRLAFTQRGIEVTLAEDPH